MPHFESVSKIGGLIWFGMLFGSILATIMCDFFISNNPNDVAFYLYPKNDNKSYSEILIYDNLTSIESSSYNATLPVILIVHGFSQNITSMMPQVVKDAYLQIGYASSYNIICADWGKLSSKWKHNVEATESTVRQFIMKLESPGDYSNAVKNVPIVGQRIKDFLKWLIDNGKLVGPGSVTVVGHSLGSQVAGRVGYFFDSQENAKIATIIGCDPAGPKYYSDKDRYSRLSSTHADFVVTIRTNMGLLGYNGEIGGIQYAMTIMDNTLQTQPGCKEIGWCSHRTCPLYLAAGITGNYVGIQYGCTCEHSWWKPNWLSGCSCKATGVDNFPFINNVPRDPQYQGQYFYLVTGVPLPYIPPNM